MSFWNAPMSDSSGKPSLRETLASIPEVMVSSRAEISILVVDRLMIYWVANMGD